MGLGDASALVRLGDISTNDVPPLLIESFCRVTEEVEEAVGGG